MKTYVFIDASNLFYGFDIEYGWKIDYSRLKTYLEKKYSGYAVLYFGGIDISIGNNDSDYIHNYSTEQTVNIDSYIKFFANIVQNNLVVVDQEIILTQKLIQKAKFYKKLESFGYTLFLKPVKHFRTDKLNYVQKKANCDVDLTLEAVINSHDFERAVILSGDGDFLPLYKHLISQGKKVFVLSRSSRTAREVKKYLGPNFLEIRKLKNQIEFKEKVSI